MRVTILNKTEYPEETICECARNDYESRWVGDLAFAETMEEIEAGDYDDVPEEVRNLNPPVDEMLTRKKWTLITHLMEHGHFGPFEHPHITFAVKGVSRSLMAQITRHRHVSFDIQSMRYVGFDDVEPEVGEAVVSIPELEEPGVAGRNAEISGGWQGVDDDALLMERRDTYEQSIKNSFEAYKKLLDMGAAPENARMVLPIGTKINMTFTLNARMLMHVADMRAAADAQWEIREMTERILEEARHWAPMTFVYYEQEMRNRKNRLAP